MGKNQSGPQLEGSEFIRESGDLTETLSTTASATMTGETASPPVDGAITFVPVLASDLPTMSEDEICALFVKSADITNPHYFSDLPLLLPFVPDRLDTHAQLRIIFDTNISPVPVNAIPRLELPGAETLCTLPKKPWSKPLKVAICCALSFWRDAHRYISSIRSTSEYYQHTVRDIVYFFHPAIFGIYQNYFEILYYDEVVPILLDPLLKRNKAQKAFLAYISLNLALTESPTVKRDSSPAPRPPSVPSPPAPEPTYHYVHLEPLYTITTFESFSITISRRWSYPNLSTPKMRAALPHYRHRPTGIPKLCKYQLNVP